MRLSGAGGSFPAAAVVVPIVVVLLGGAMLVWVGYRWRRRRRPQKRHKETLRSPWEEPLPVRVSITSLVVACDVCKLNCVLCFEELAVGTQGPTRRLESSNTTSFQPELQAGCP